MFSIRGKGSSLCLSGPDLGLYPKIPLAPNAPPQLGSTANWSFSLSMSTVDSNKLDSGFV